MSNANELAGRGERRTEFVDRNWLKDPSFSPGCHMCSSRYRMNHAHDGWRCGSCGAAHDSPAKRRRNKEREWAAADAATPQL